MTLTCWQRWMKRDPWLIRTDLGTMNVFTAIQPTVGEMWSSRVWITQTQVSLFLMWLIITWPIWREELHWKDGTLLSRQSHLGAWTSTYLGPFVLTAAPTGRGLREGFLQRTAFWETESTRPFCELAKQISQTPLMQKAMQSRWSTRRPLGCRQGRFKVQAK